MTDDLSDQQLEIVNNIWPATSRQTADALGSSLSYSWDVAQRIREKGYNVSQNSEGEYFIPEIHDADNTPNHIKARRTTTEAKSAITRKVKKFLAELEGELQGELESAEPVALDGGLPREEGNQDFIGHYTDLHFGQVITNQDGETVYDSEIADLRFRATVEEGLQRAENRRAMGVDFDAAHVLLGGDIVTNENIYEGQAHEIDETVSNQIQRASEAIMWAIRQYASTFPTVQVVCVPGNHGEFRTGNSSNHANADTILYDAIELAVRNSPELDNIQFVRTDSVYYVDFQVRDWSAHMRHGHDASLEHIGTSAGKQRWGQWLLDHDFDVAFRGHYHQFKIEPISGVPVVMGGSITPQSGFEESMGISGRPVAAVHGATDASSLQWTEMITLG